MNAVIRWVVTLVQVAVGIACAQQYQISTVVGGSFPLGPMPALEVAVGHVSGVATDRAGNVYFSSGLHCVFKLDLNGSLTRVAGTCQWGFAGDGGQATNAELSWPQGLAIDSAGSLYIADHDNGRIRKLHTDGTIATIAGSGACCVSSGDGGPASRAVLVRPRAVAVDPSGTVYVAEADRVRKISPSGTITTVAAGLHDVTGVAVDFSGGLYIADGTQVLKVAPDGTMVAVAGRSGTSFDSGDGGPAVDATFDRLIGLAFDSDGNLILAGRTIRSISSDGIVHTIAGEACCSVPNVSRSWADSGGAVAVDLSGTVYVAVLIDDVLRKITPSGVVTAAAGTDHPSYIGDGGLAISAQLSNPQAVAVDADGNLYIADYSNSRVRKVWIDGIISTVAGNGTSGFSGDGGLATSAQLGGPVGLAVDSAGNLFISEYLNNRVRKVTPDGLIRTVAGSGLCCDPGDGGLATDAVLASPHGIAVDSDQNLYIADFLWSRVRKVTPNGVITTLAGSGVRGFSGDDGPATEARLNQPWSVAVDSTGNVYVADQQNLRVRKISTDGVITTVASGVAINPYGVAVDSNGNVIICGGAALWKASLSGNLSELLAYSSAGRPTPARGIALAVDAHGNVFLVSGNRVLKLSARL